MKATNAHIVLCGHCTKAELLKCLDNLSLHNGFANRLLFFAVRRSKFLPDGGNIHRENLNDLVTNLKAARDHAFNLPESNRILERTPEAAELWRAIYPELSGGGHGLPQLGTERAAPQVLRLSVVYALLDRRHSVDVPHLQAALAVWQYCRQSAVYIFGESSGDKNAETILAALREAGDKGLMRSEINNLLGRNLSKEQVTEALNLLCAHDLAAPTVWRHKGGKGRPATIWTVKKHEKRQNTTLHDINPTAPEEGGTFVVNIVGSGENKMPPEAQNPELETLL